MIHIQGIIPRTVFVGFSGGVDSVAAVDFLSKNHSVILVHVNHGNDIAEDEQAFADEFSCKRGLPILYFKGAAQKAKSHSWEEHWRIERYKAFRQVNGTVVTCHHLDDCVETWLWNMCNGRDQTIAYKNRNVIRPFRTTRKNEFVDWCRNKDLKWFEDASNSDPNFAVRNYIRHVLLPNAQKVNPGIHSTIRKKLLQEKI